MPRKRVMGVKTRTRTSPRGETPAVYETGNQGAVLSTDWEGNYSLLLEVDTDIVGDNGYPVRAKLEKAKYVARDKDGAVLKTINKTYVDDDGKLNTFINLIAWEDLKGRPPKED